jgi:hypothetical protein
MRILLFEFAAAPLVERRGQKACATPIRVERAVVPRRLRIAVPELEAA